jgi:NADH-quinone oxidoreductase subunit L
MICDIKAIIALSTISQISYMYCALLINPWLCLFHIIIHAFFKSLLFLLAGTIIHYTLNYQSVYKMKINHSYIRILFILASCVLVLSLSKEIIIYSAVIQLSFSIIFILLWCGAGFTFLYVIKLYYYLFLLLLLYRSAND